MLELIKKHALLTNGKFTYHQDEHDTQLKHWEENEEPSYTILMKCSMSQFLSEANALNIAVNLRKICEAITNKYGRKIIAFEFNGK